MQCLKEYTQGNFKLTKKLEKLIKNNNSDEFVDEALKNYSGPKNQAEVLNQDTYNNNVNTFINDVKNLLSKINISDDIIQTVEDNLRSKLDIFSPESTESNILEASTPETDSSQENDDDSSQNDTEEKKEKKLSAYLKEAYGDDRLLKRDFQESFNLEVFDRLIIDFSNEKLITGLKDLNLNIIEFKNKLYNIVYTYLKSISPEDSDIKKIASIYVKNKEGDYSIQSEYIDNINKFIKYLNSKSQEELHKEIIKGKRGEDRDNKNSFARAFEAFLQLEYFDEMLLDSVGSYLYINKNQVTPIEITEKGTKYKYSINKRNVNLASGWQNSVRDGIAEAGNFTNLLIQRIPLLDGKNKSSRRLFKTEFFTSLLRLQETVGLLTSSEDEEINTLVKAFGQLSSNPKEAWETMLRIVAENTNIFHELQKLSPKNDPITENDYNVWRSIYKFLFKGGIINGKKQSSIVEIEKNHLFRGFDYSCYSIVDTLIGAINSTSQSNYIDFMEEDGELKLHYKPKWWSQQRLFQFLKNANDKICREKIPYLDNIVNVSVSSVTNEKTNEKGEKYQVEATQYVYTLGEEVGNYKIIITSEGNSPKNIFSTSFNCTIYLDDKNIAFSKLFSSEIGMLNSIEGRRELLTSPKYNDFIKFLKFIDLTLGTSYSTSDGGLQQLRILLEIRQSEDSISGAGILKKAFLQAVRVSEAYRLNRKFLDYVEDDENDLSVFELERWLETKPEEVTDIYPDLEFLRIDGNTNLIYSTQRGYYFRGLTKDNKKENDVVDSIVEAETIYHGDNNSSTTRNFDRDVIPNVSVAFTKAKQELLEQGITKNRDSIMSDLLFAGENHTALITTVIDSDIKTRYGNKQVKEFNEQELLTHNINKFIRGISDFGGAFISQPVTYSDKTKFLNFVIKYDKIRNFFSKNNIFSVTPQEYVEKINKTIGSYYKRLFAKIVNDYRNIFKISDRNVILKSVFKGNEIKLQILENFISELQNIKENNQFFARVNSFLESGNITKEELINLSTLNGVEIFEEIHYRKFKNKGKDVLTANELCYTYVTSIYSNDNVLQKFLNKELISYIQTLLNKNVFIKIIGSERDDDKNSSEYQTLKNAILSSQSLPSDLRNVDSWRTKSKNMIYAYKVVFNETTQKNDYVPILWGDDINSEDTIIFNPLIETQFYMSNLINNNLKLHLSGNEMVHTVKVLYKTSPNLNEEEAAFLNKQLKSESFSKGNNSVISVHDGLARLSGKLKRMKLSDQTLYQSILSKLKRSSYALISQSQKAQFKRTVPITGTMRLFSQDTIKGIPSKYNVAVVEDLQAQVRDFTGDNGFAEEVTIDAHDGSAWVDPFTSILENNSLEDSKAGDVKKPIWDINEYKYGLRRLVKYASDTITNRIMLNSLNSSISMYRVFKKMTNMQWGENEIDLIDDWAICDYEENSFVENILNGQQLYYEQNGNYYRIINFNKEEIEGQKVYYTKEREVNRQGKEAIGNIYKVYHFFDENSNHIRVKENQLQNFLKNRTKSYHTINSLFELHSAMGGIKSCSLVDNNLEYSEISNQAVANFMIYVSTPKTDEEDPPVTQKYYNQPLKRKLINCLINHSAIKNGASNINSVNTLFNDESFKYSEFSTLKYGIQQDSDHTADEGKVTEMSQVISALDATGLYHDEIYKIYKAIGEQSVKAAGIELSILKQLKGFGNKEEAKNKFYGIIGRTILNNINQDQRGLTRAILYQIRKEFKFDWNHSLDELKIPFSDPNIYNKLLSIVGSVLNSKSIKRKYSGLGQVMVPSFGIYQIWEINGKKYQYLDLLKQALKWNKDNKVVSQEGKDPIVYDKEVVNAYLDYMLPEKESDIIFLSEKWGNIQDLDPCQNVIITYQDSDAQIQEVKLNLGSLSLYYSISLQDTESLRNILEKKLNKQISTIQSIKIDRKSPRDLAPTRIKFKYETAGKEIKKINIYNTWLYKELYLAEKANQQKDVARLKKLIPKFFEYLDKNIYWQKDGSQLKITELENLPAEVIMSNIYASKFNMNEYTEMPDVVDSNFYLDVKILNNKVNDYDFQMVTSNGENLYVSLDWDGKPSNKYISRYKSWGTLIYPEEYKGETSKVVSRVYFINKNNEKQFEIGRYIYADDVIYDSQNGQYKYKEDSKEHKQGEIVENRELKIDKKSGRVVEYIEFVSRYEIKPKKGNSYIKYNFNTKNFSRCCLDEEKFYINSKGNQRKNSISSIIGQHIYNIFKSKSFLFISPGQYVDPNKVENIKEILQKIRNNSSDNILHQYLDSVIKLIGNKQNSTSKEFIDLDDVDILKCLKNTFKHLEIKDIKNLINSIVETGKNVKGNKKFFDENGIYIGGYSNKDLNLLYNLIKMVLNKELKVDNKTELIESVLENFKNNILTNRITSYRQKLLKAKGSYKLSSFKKSLNFISSRIPAQTLQSFMKMECVGFNGVNTNYCAVSHFQAFLQGSDYDIDKSYMMGFQYDDNGLFIGWSDLFDLSSYENLEISTELPIPRNLKYNISNESLENSLDVSSYIQEHINLEKLLEIERKNKNNEQIILLRRQRLRNLVNLLNYIYNKNKKESITSINLYGDYAEEDIKYVEDLKGLLTKHENTNLGNNSNSALLNYISNNIQKISQSLQNTPANYTPVTMIDLRRLLSDCPKYIESDSLTLLNPAMVYIMQRINMEGKQGTGIAANAQKGLFLWRFGVLEALRSGNKDQVKFDVQIDGIKDRYKVNKGKALKTQPVHIQTLPGFSSYGLNCLFPLRSSDITGSEYISAATDNAKELILSIINSGTNLMKYHLYLVSLGFDVEDIVAFMTSPTISLIDDMSVINIFDGTNISIPKVINFIRKCIEKDDLSKVNISGVSVDLLNAFKSRIKKLKEQNKLSLEDLNTFEYLTNGATEYTVFSILLGINQGIPMTKEELIKWKKNLKQAATNGLINVGLLDPYGNIDKIKVVSYLLEEYKESPDMQISDFIQKHQDLFEDIDQDLKEEDKMVELFKKINKLYNFDTDRWLSDPKYKEEIANEYNKYKFTINVFYMLNSIPHINNMFEVAEVLNQTDQQFALKSKLLDYYSEKIDEKFSHVTVDYKMKFTQAIDNVIISHYIKTLDSQITIPLKDGWKVFDSKFKLGDGSTQLILDSNTNLSSFKYVFENYIIPEMQAGKLFDTEEANNIIMNNAFIRALVRTTQKDTPVYKLNIDMMQINSNQQIAEQYQEYLNAMKELRDIKYGNYSVLDLFMAYNLLINRNQYGSDRFTELFEDFIGKDSNSFLYKYLAYIGDIDWSKKLYNQIVESVTPTDVAIDIARIVSASQINTSKDPYVLLRKDIDSPLQIIERDNFGSYNLESPLDLLAPIEGEDPLSRLQREINYIEYGQGSLYSQYIGELIKELESDNYKETLGYLMQNLTIIYSNKCDD